MFDINNYDVSFAICSFIFYVFCFLFIFKNFISNTADPLIFHLIWISSNATFFSIYIQKYGFSLILLHLILIFIFYISSLFLFLNIYSLNFNGYKVIKAKRDKNFLSNVIWILFILQLYSYSAFFEYALTVNNFPSLFAFRFLDMQGRNPIERILGNSDLFLLFYLFYAIKINVYKVRSFIILFILTSISIVSGGRSSLITLLLSFGLFIFLMKD